jgi:medium-chain acyl-[acyl-carrier-protein] hydrolase
LRLFCLPYAGGGASIFRRWSAGLPGSVEVCPIQLPGRETRLKEPPFTRLSPLLHALGDAVRPYLDRPFALYGHSLGALIAFELARYLRRTGNPGPVHLLASGRAAPQLRPPHEAINALPEPEFVERVRALGGTPDAVLADRELRKILVPLLRADFSILETYSYTDEPPLDCPITVFGGLQDPRAGTPELQAWRVQTAAHFSVQMLPGDHFFLRTAQDLLLRMLTLELPIGAPEPGGLQMFRAAALLPGADPHPD